MEIERLLKKMLIKGADPNIQDMDGNTSLHFLPNRKSTERMKEFSRLLIKYDAELNAMNEEEETPVHSAVNANYGLLLDVLFKEGADVNIKDYRGNTPITKSFSAPLRSADILRNLGNQLLNIRNYKNNKVGDYWRIDHPFFNSHSKRMSVMKILRNSNQGINLRDKNGWTVLHCVGNLGNISYTRKLLRMGADVNAISSNGFTPLNQACMSKHADCMEGADVNIRDNMGYTPVTKAFSAPLRSADILRNLGNQLIMKHECKFQVDLDVLYYIIGYEGFMNFKIKCADEILKLKQKLFHNSTISYYDSLIASPHKVAKCVGNDDILQDLIIFYKNESDFGNLIIGNFKKGLRRHKAAQKLREIFSVVLPSSPNVCIDEILENLDSRNIEKLGE
ncbi:hypothetical protein WA026_002850 [Henosepilachna vigintioctopunctata]|uniref:Uncharacterized protein n=1 Tax=Henosepilachna vigintioctopunctata TaxID=420089 RepID=A0AAW1U547_9CUCU